MSPASSPILKTRLGAPSSIMVAKNQFGARRVASHCRAMIIWHRAPARTTRKSFDTCGSAAGSRLGLLGAGVVRRSLKAMTVLVQDLYER